MRSYHLLRETPWSTKVLRSVLGEDSLGLR